MLTLLTPRKAINYEIEYLLASSRAQRLRGMGQFAEDEIVIPEGRHAGRKFRYSMQPYPRLIYEAIDSGQWRRFVFTGPTQSGKTLSCNVVPLLYYLFERREPVIYGLPDADMFEDKWKVDILPAIERTRYRELLSGRGPGSRGGAFNLIEFLNGARLKCLTAGGGDKSRAGYTSRILIATETDGYDVSSETSREASKIRQMAGRLLADPEHSVEIYECTCSTEEGFIWSEYKNNSTASRIALPCPHCAEYVTLEREYFRGWEDAENEIDAGAAGCFWCSACGTAWSDDERRAANQRGVLVHRGQEIDAVGVVTGPMPKTLTLGFRWSAVNNLFWRQEDIAQRAWRASKGQDEDNEEKEQRQFWWALPYQPPQIDTIPLSEEAIRTRVGVLRRGFLPEDTACTVVQVDVHRYTHYWMLCAGRKNGSLHMIDWGAHPVNTGKMDEGLAITLALREMRDIFEAGWPSPSGTGVWVPNQVWIDSRYMTDTVFKFCKEANRGLPAMRYRPTQGFGQLLKWRYTPPKVKGKTVIFMGDQYHIARIAGKRIDVVQINSDYWKTQTHAALVQDAAAPGAITFFNAPPHEHIKLSKQLTAEKHVEEFVPGKGLVAGWKVIRQENHLFDCLYGCKCAAHFCGARVMQDEKPAAVSLSDWFGGRK